MNAFLGRVKDILKQDERLFVDDKILKNKCIELSLKADEGLIRLLLENGETKDFFFKPVLDALVFESNKFNQFISNEAFLDDSYTAYKNKIGLATDSTHYLAESSEVVLNWPYKDCVLEGGQDKDDAKRKEVFWNEILGHDQQDTLLAPKVLEGFKRITKDGEEEVSELSYDDNLIIKGNNLLALHTLKKRYAGKVKLIYIDPPYNTGSDSFGYNDSFNHSTWLTFMKNRLEVARTLLKDDGVIFVQCDDNEQAYLKVLMDDIFGRTNFESNIAWRRRHNQPNDKTKMIALVAENILVYARNSVILKSNDAFYTLPLSVDRVENYKNRDNDPRGNWDTTPWKTSTNQGGSKYKITTPGGTVYDQEWMGTEDNFKSLLKDNRIIFSNAGKGLPRKKVFLEERLLSGQPAHNFWDHLSSGSNQEGSSELDKLFSKGSFSNPKPERLLQKIITLTTKEGDMILDYHLGSGTTAAVAHKMGRRYIGIEQMPMTLENVVKPRLKKVIDGEQGGISKAVNWQGGGSYVYCHLKNNANSFIKQVQAAKNVDELVKLLNQIKKSNFLSYRIDADKLEEAEFKQLRLDIAQRILIDLVEKNKLYVNYLDIDDTDYGIDDATKKLNVKMQSRD